MNQQLAQSSLESVGRLPPHGICPVCGSKEVRPFLSSEDFHFGSEGTYSTSRCSECDLVYLDPMMTITELSKHYPADYYSFTPPVLNNGLRYKLSKLVGFRTQTYLPPFAHPGVMLDLGCGAGQYLLEMQAHGWQVFGSELSRQAAAAGQHAGLDIRPGELMEAGFKSNQFDFIRSNHSFEHIPNPREVLEEIGRILKQDGWLMIGVPNIDSFPARFFGKHWWHLSLPIHTYNYSVKSLSRLLMSAGFTIKMIRFNSNFGSFAGSLQIRRNDAQGKLSSEGPLLHSTLLKILGHLSAKICDLFGTGDCIEIVCRKSS